MQNLQSFLSTFLNAASIFDVNLDGNVIGDVAPRTERSFEPNTLLNGIYRIVDVLGEGGMGIVYRAADQVQGRIVALKTIRGDALKHDQVALFKTEFRTLTELRHPNVAAAYDFGPIRGTDAYFFTMEYVDGSTIYDATRDSTWSEVLDHLVPVLRALAYVHSRGVIHFDLKPANVLVDHRGTVKVLDFGVAGVKHVFPMAQVRGTVQYMAPELFNVSAQVDHRADLYSFGIMAYQLLCRKLPFDAPSLTALVEQHHLAPLVFDEEALPRVPVWLRNVVNRLCAKSPADRYRTANAVIEALNRESGRSYEIETKQTRESYILSSRFVGREAEHAQILGFVAERVRGDKREPPALFVAGVSGVGKSRLMREVRLQAQLARITFLEGNCYEGSFAEYGPLLTVIEHLARMSEAAGAVAILERYGPEIVKLDPRVLSDGRIAPSPPLDDGERERLRRLDQVTEFFLRVAEVAPYVIYLDNLQWASAGIMDLLAYLIRRVALAERAGTRIRCGLLGSYRDDEVEGHPLKKTLLEDLPGLYRSIGLTHLDREQVGQLLSSMLGIEQLPDAFARRVTAETAGNAFFVEEVMRTLVENGSVYLEQGEWAARETIGELQIPASMENVFRRRASLLGPGLRSVLDVMAVYGQPIVPGLLQAVTECEVETLHGHLAELQRRQMVRPVPGDDLSYQLLHDRIRETLYEDLGDEGRRARHRSIAEALENRKDADAYVYELAHHFWHAQERQRALTWCLYAGERAERGYANERAIELFQRVLQLLLGQRRSDAPELERRVTEKLGDLHTLQGGFGQALTYYHAVLAKADSDTDRARLSRKLGQVHWQKGELAEAATALWNAIEQLGDRRPKSKPAVGAATLAGVVTHLGHRLLRAGRHEHAIPDERARLLELTTVYSYLGEVYFFYRPSEMLLPIVRAANVGERAGSDSRELVVAYRAVMVVYGTLTLWDSAQKYARRLAEMAARLKSDWHVGIGHAYRLILHYYMAEWARGIEEGHKAKELLLRCGDMVELSFVYWLLALCHYYRGNLAEALGIAKEGIATMERSDSQQPSKGILAVGARVQARLGNHEAAAELMERSVALCEQSQDQFFSTWVQMMKGDCHLIAGEIDEAIACLDAALKSREENGLLPEYLVEIYSLLATAMLEKLRAEREHLGSTERRQRIKEIRQIAQKGVALSRRRHCYYAPSLRSAAAAAFLSGEEPQGRDLFFRSIAHAERVGAPLQLGETHLEVARCLLDANQRDQARQHLHAALELFERARALPYVERVRALLC